GTAYLIYLMLDGSRPPQHDPKRIYIDAANRPLKDVGSDLVRAIHKVSMGSKQYSCDEDEPL
ncbi:MAG: hypothetical protein ACI9HK_005056, partial [Pirellulaceae bacterium]